MGNPDRDDRVDGPPGGACPRRGRPGTAAGRDWIARPRSPRKVELGSSVAQPVRPPPVGPWARRPPWLARVQLVLRRLCLRGGSGRALHGALVGVPARLRASGVPRLSGISRLFRVSRLSGWVSRLRGSRLSVAAAGAPSWARRAGLSGLDGTDTGASVLGAGAPRGGPGGSGASEPRRRRSAAARGRLRDRHRRRPLGDARVLGRSALDGLDSDHHAVSLPLGLLSVDRVGLDEPRQRSA
jgi:hypothetical protein